MRFRTEDDLKIAGFEGYFKAKDWEQTKETVPQEGGVYMILRVSKKRPVFLEKGPIEEYQGKAMNVPPEELIRKWVDDACVVYIGCSGSLRNRLKECFKYGEGKGTEHRGGRRIWQLKDAGEFIFCWKVFRGEQVNLSKIKKDLIEEFKSQYGGKKPFGNC